MAEFVGTPSTPLEIGFNPGRHSLLPLEVLQRNEIVARMGANESSSRQRLAFHQLILCYDGTGVHYVDYEPIEMKRGTLLHVHPGQVQEYQFEPDFDAHVVIYRADLHRTFIPGLEWFPGSDVPTKWVLEPEDCALARPSLEQLRKEQENFDGSPAYIVLLESLLATFLARIHLVLAEPPPPTRLPEPYIRFRRFVEAHLGERTTVTNCADELGYSTRTLDRACLAAVGQTAKQVLDERTVFEIRRLITHTDLPITQVGASFGFGDASAFSKYVHRHLGDSPTNIRALDLVARESARA